MTTSQIVAEIRRHAEWICHHPESCEYWKGHGCEISMLHDGKDILDLVAKLEEALR